VWLNPRIRCVLTSTTRLHTLLPLLLALLVAQEQSSAPDFPVQPDTQGQQPAQQQVR
jgi:hypothetical protein